MAWEFERDGEVVKVDVTGPLTVSLGGATDLLVDAAIAGTGIVSLFEDWLRPHFESGALEPILEPWWQRFRGTVSLLSWSDGLCRRQLRALCRSSRYRRTKSYGEHPGCRSEPPCPLEDGKRVRPSCL